MRMMPRARAQRNVCGGRVSSRSPERVRPSRMGVADPGLVALMMADRGFIDACRAGRPFDETVVVDWLDRLDACLRARDPRLTVLDFDMRLMPARVDGEGTPVRRFDDLTVVLRPGVRAVAAGRVFDSPERLADWWGTRLRA